MNYIFAEKLRDKSGESIAETLVAVLIAAFALLMLAGTVNTSTNLVLKSQKILSDSKDGYYVKNNAMEKRDDSSKEEPSKEEKTITITIIGGADKQISEKANLYKNDKFGNNQIFVYDISK